MEYIKKVLKNGVKLYLYPDAKMKRTFVSYGVNYGSSGKYFKFYYKDKFYEVGPGAAHFLEHMLGEHSKYGNIYNYFSEQRYSTNAFTGQDYTYYYFCGMTDIKKSIEMIIRMVDEPVFTKEDVEETKKAIVEETKRGLNNKASVCYALYYYNLYKDINLFDESLSSIGNEETTNLLDYDTLKLCYDAFYYDENKTLLIAGAFDEEEMTKYIETIYAKIKNHKKEIKYYECLNLDEVKNRKSVHYMSTSDDLVLIGFKEKNQKYSKKEIYIYLDFLLDSKFSSDRKFIQDLKYEDIISSFAFDLHYFLDDENYDFCVSFNSKNNSVLIKKVIEELKINNFSKKDFELYIKESIADEARSIDYKYNKFLSFMRIKDISDNFTDVDFFKSLSFDDFIDFYHSLNFDNYIISIIKDSSKKED